MARQTRRRNARGEWICSDCRHWKPASDFRDAPGNGVKDTWCKPCRSAYSAAYQRTRYRHDAAYRERRRVEAMKQAERRRAVNADNLAFRRQHAPRLIDRAMRAGWTQTALAAAIGTSQEVVSHWRRSQRVPRPAQFDALSRFVRGLENHS